MGKRQKEQVIIAACPAYGYEFGGTLCCKGKMERREASKTMIKDDAPPTSLLPSPAG